MAFTIMLVVKISEVNACSSLSPSYASVNKASTRSGGSTTCHSTSYSQTEHGEKTMVAEMMPSCISDIIEGDYTEGVALSITVAANLMTSSSNGCLVGAVDVANTVEAGTRSDSYGNALVSNDYFTRVNYQMYNPFKPPAWQPYW